MKKKVKLTESQLRSLVMKCASKILNEVNSMNEFRGNGDDDGDTRYIRPNGKDFSYNDDLTKFFHHRNLDSLIDKKEMGNRRNGSSNELSAGKGNLVWNVMKYMADKFQFDVVYTKPNGKIEWTDAEVEKIREISKALSALAKLTKEEGNKKRGYNGPDEKEEEPEAEPALSLSESKPVEPLEEH